MAAAHEWLCEWQPLPHQIEPEVDYFIWIMQWGAGSGKTYTGAQVVRDRIDRGIWRTVNIAGPTWTDTMRTMVQGTAQAPGLMGIWPPDQRPEMRASKDDPYLRCHNGAKIQLFAAQKAERFRGPAADGAWADEIDAWKPEQMKPADAFMLMEQRIRTGTDPRIICTTTPKRRGLVAKLRTRSDCVVTRASMWDNAINLAPSYIRSQEENYKGTRLGRQELEGDILPDTEGAIVSPAIIDATRVTEAPDLTRVVVGVDPSGTKTGDTQGIVVKGKGVDGHGYTLADRTCRLSPEGWGRRAVDAHHEFDADCLVVEVNYGGDMCEAVIRGIDPSVRVKKVTATRGKHVRFEPLAGRYERGEEHHVGTFAALEDEVCAFTPDGYDGDESPGRADAAVWATTELFPVRAGVSPDEALAFMREEEARA